MTTLAEDIELVRDQLRRWHARMTIPMYCVPPEMQEGSGPEEDEECQYWKLVDSTYSVEMIDRFEERLPAPLPQYFKAFMLAYHTMCVDFGDYQLPASPCNESLEKNFAELLNDQLWEAGYILIGGARGCGDPLLLDFESATSDGDYPVAVFNHDVVPFEILRDRIRLKPYESLLASSFREFFRLLTEHDDAIFPPPPSPEEVRRNEAWQEVRTLLKQRGLGPYDYPEGVSSSDPWEIAKFLRESD